MTLIRTVEPAAEPVTLADVKAHLRLDTDADDTLLSGLIAAARYKSGYGDGTLRRDFAAQTALSLSLFGTNFAQPAIVTLTKIGNVAVTSSNARVTSPDQQKAMTGRMNALR